MPPRRLPYPVVKCSREISVASRGQPVVLGCRPGHGGTGGTSGVYPRPDSGIRQSPIGALGGAVLWVGGDQGILSGARPACVVSQNAEFLDGGSWFTQRVMHSEILSPAQQSALAVLSQPPELYDFYLAGGTALALHLGHRISEDFDFFRK